MSDWLGSLLQRLKISELLKPRNRWIVISLLVIYAAFYAAKMANSILSYLISRKVQAEIRLPDDTDFGSSYGGYGQDYSSIYLRNIFDSKAKEKRAKMLEEQDIDPDTAIKTTLDVKLIGTAVFSIPEMSVAVIQDRAGQVNQIAHIGDMIRDAMLVKVERLRILMQRNGRLEFLENEQAALPWRKAGEIPTSIVPGGLSPAITSVPERPENDSNDPIRWSTPDKAVIPQTEIERVMSNMSDVITQARVVPNMAGDKQDGFKIFAIKGGSIFERIGLKDGDVLKRINGQELNSLEKGMELFSALRNEKNIALDLIRDGQRKSYNFEIR